ncbi:13897_t:CDS:2 [Entrophospora sp. SA101]|nr:13897_t:CDS:2 [Entrophospora sp. SA101]
MFSTSSSSAITESIIETTDNSNEVKGKQEWVKQMRLKFSIRPDLEITKNIVYSDGTLNQDYFPLEIVQ